MKHKVFILIVFVGFLSFLLQARVVYEEFKDEHEHGMWTGYIYYKQSVGIPNDLTPTQIILTSQQGLAIINRKIKFDPKTFRWLCNSEKNAPCSLKDYFDKFPQKDFPNFQTEVDQFINEIKVENKFEQCFILQTFSQNKLWPHLICLYVQGQGENLKKALKQAYLFRIKFSDLESIVDNVQLNEKFRIKYTNDLFSTTDTFAFLKTSDLVDEKLKPLVKYSSIFGFDDSPCQVAYRNLVLPEQFQNIKDPYCCIGFKQSKEQWFICSIEEEDCITPIRRMALFMLSRCRQQYLPPGLSGTPNPKTIVDQKQEGFFSAWGYFAPFPGIPDASFNPVFIKLEDFQFKLSKLENSEAIISISINPFAWFCGEDEICSPKDYQRFSSSSKTIDLEMSEINTFMKKVGIEKTESCGVFINERNNDRFLMCLMNPLHFSILKAAYLQARHLILVTSASFEPLADNSLVNFIVSDGELFYNGPLQFTQDTLNYFGKKNSTLFAYTDIEAIGNSTCRVLIEKLSLPDKLLEKIGKPNARCCFGVKLYNRMIFLCLNEAGGCDYTMRRAIKKIESRCEKSRYPTTTEHTSTLNFNSYTIDNHNEGKWEGYVKYARLGAEVPSRPMFIKVDPLLGLRVFDLPEEKNGELIEKMSLMNLEWLCESSLPCSTNEYLSLKNEPNLESLMSLTAKQLNIESLQNCVSLEFRLNNFHLSEKIVTLLCPYDFDQIQNIKYSVKNGFDYLIRNSKIENIPFAPEGSEPTILYYDDSKSTEISMKARLTPNYMEELQPERNVLFEYRDIKPQNETKCGIKFRDIWLPDVLKKHKIDPQCCFTFIKNNDNIYICSNEETRCIANSRMIMKRVKANCIRNLAEEGRATDEEIMKSLETIEVKTFEDEASRNFLSNQSRVDPWLKVNFKDNQWQGKIYYAPLEKRENLEMKIGFLSVNNRTVKISKEPQVLNLVEGSAISFHVFTLYFSCNSPNMCYPTSYIKRMKKINEDFDQKLLEKGIDSFMQQVPEYKESACLILENENPYFHSIASFIVCTVAKAQGPVLNQILSNAYHQEITKIRDLAEVDVKYIPNTSVKDVFGLQIYDPETHEVAVKKVKLNDFITRDDVTDFIIVRYKEIQNCTINFFLNETLKAMILSSEKRECCFSIKRFDQSMILCTEEQFRCLRSKYMIMKKMYLGCNSNEDQKPLGFTLHIAVKEKFSFNLEREGLKIDPKTDLLSLRKDLLEDRENGKWQGWVFAQSLTDRDDTLPLIAYFLEIDELSVILRKKKDGPILFEYDTKNLNWICEGLKEPCLPTEYMKVYKKKNSYQGQLELKYAILNMLKQLPTENESNCMVLEFEDPNSRSVSSEMICTVHPVDGDGLRGAIPAAYYKSALKMRIHKDVPNLSYGESFDVKTWEEGKLIEDRIKFDKSAILKDLQGERFELYKFSDIAGDKQGNLCGIWYKNLRLPEDFGDFDNNCCFSFIKKDGKQVIICSNKMHRCVQPTFQMMKKTKIECLAYNKNKLPNPYQSENSATSTKPENSYNQYLYDDSNNGAWRGLVFARRLFSNDAVSENPIFLVIDKESLSIYRDPWKINEDALDQTPLESRKIINLKFPCNQMYTCDPAHYQQYFNEIIASNKYEQDKLAEETLKVTKQLPLNSDTESCCTVLQFADPRGEGSLGTEAKIIICTADPVQGENIKKALTKSFNSIVFYSDIEKDIPLAKGTEEFKVQFFDPLKRQVKYRTMRFGKTFAMDSKLGEQFFKYVDIQGDKFNHSCSIWYTKLNIPKEMTVPNPSCCFLFSINDQDYYFCSDDGFHCMMPSRKMMKTIKKGCLAGPEGIILDMGSGSGQKKEDPSKVEILGSDLVPVGMSDLAKKLELLKTVSKHNYKEDLDFKPEEGYFKSWMIETVLPNRDAEALNPREVFVTISSLGFQIFLKKNQELQESYKITQLNWICDKETLCLPAEALNIYKKTESDARRVSAFEFAKEDLMKMIASEEQCFALDLKVPTSSVSQKRVLCLLENNNLLLQSLHKSILKAYSLAVETISYADIIIPEPDNERYTSLFYRPGQSRPKSVRMSLGDTGLLYNYISVIEYDQPDDCQFCYGVANEIVLQTNKDCCIKFKVKGKRGYLCQQEQYRCEWKTKQLSKFLYEKCIYLNRAAPKYPPAYCILEKIEPLPFAIGDELIGNAMSGNLENANKILNANIMNIEKSGGSLNNVDNIVQSAGNLIQPSKSPQPEGSKSKDMIFKQLADENVRQISLSDRLKKDVQSNLAKLNTAIVGLNKTPIRAPTYINGDKITYNTDGSISIEKPDGTQLIVELDGKSQATIYADNSIKISLADKTEYTVKQNGFNEVKLPDGEDIVTGKDGKIEVKKDEYDMMLNQDGSSVLSESNGEVTTVSPDEKKAVTSMPDGSRVIRKSDEETEVDFKGTITIVKSEPLDLGGFMQPRLKEIAFIAEAAKSQCAKGDMGHHFKVKTGRKKLISFK